MGGTGADFGMTGVARGAKGHRAGHAWQMSQAGYWEGQFRNMKDPFLTAGLRQSRNLAQSDLMGMGKAMGNRGADMQSRGLQDALASRGGGNLASALSMGSQARVGAGLQGLQAGFGMQNQANQTLLGGAQARLGLMNQLYGMLQGVNSTQIGASFGLAGDVTKSAASMWGDAFSAGASMSGGGGDGGGD